MMKTIIIKSALFLNIFGFASAFATNVFSNETNCTPISEYNSEWIRSHVYRNLRNNTNFDKFCIIPQFSRFDPWGLTNDIDIEVDAFCVSFEKNKGKVSHTKYNLSAERINKIQKSEMNDEKMLAPLIGAAVHRLNTGDKQAIYLLIALLDYESINIQAQALSWLILRTNPELYPADGKGLMLGALQPEVVSAKKKAWLAWWESNKDSFKLKPRKIIK